MPEETKPAEGNGGHREIVIADWRPHSKNTLRGFFTAVLPSGLVLHDLMLHERNGARWVGFPSREWKDAEGNRQFACLIDFSSRATANRFREQVLDALDAYLEAEQ
jgi:hypothetical protein